MPPREIFGSDARHSVAARRYFGLQRLLGVHGNGDESIVVAPRRDAGGHAIDVRCRLDDRRVVCVVVVRNAFTLYRPDCDPEDREATSESPNTFFKKRVVAAPAPDDDGAEFGSDEWMHVRTVVTDELVLNPGDAALDNAWSRTLSVSGG